MVKQNRTLLKVFVAVTFLALATIVFGGEWIRPIDPQVICEVWFEDELAAGIVTEIPLADVHYNISGFNSTSHSSNRGTFLENCVFNDDIASELVPNIGGLYELHFTMSFEKASGGGSARTYEVAIFVNDVEDESLEFHTVLTKQDELNSHAVGGFIRLKAGDRVNARIEATGGTDDIGTHNANLHFDRHSD